LENRTWTVKDILGWTQNYFGEKNIDAPRITSELLLGKALSMTRVSLYLNYDRPLTEAELKEYKSYIQRRVSGEPAQYITGVKEFWSLDFKVTPDVLIPRADTETLVEAVINDIKDAGRKSVRMLEIGTGSGAVSVSIAHELKDEIDIRIKAVDISGDALEVARENADSNGVAENIEFVLSDGFEKIVSGEKYDYIVSNPPYISEEFYDGLERTVKDFEPKIALYGGADGLTFYREIFSKGYEHLSETGKIFVEIDQRKTKELEKIVDRLKYFNIVYYKDLVGHKRVIELIKKKVN
jgi:release factor glutamine methyltransferase